MKSQAERLNSLPRAERDAFIDSLTEAQCEELKYDWAGFYARPDQIEPAGDWNIWLVLAGRGYGKTRVGAEWIKAQVANGVGRVALVGETAADCRDVMVEGESGILSIYPKSDRPVYEPSKRQLTFQNGAIGKLYNATEPDQLRGPQHGAAWCDELAKWRYARESWDQLQFGLRLGDHPRQIVTTTPRPIELIKSIVAGGEGPAMITRGRTLDNRANLAGTFLDQIIAKHSGTRLGRQELDGEILGDLPGALWSLSNIDTYRITTPPEEFDRIVVSVDPAVSNNDNSDEHGIIVAGVLGQSGYVLEDASMRGSPLAWARRAIALQDKYDADGIVVETNQGGDMVAQTLRSVRETVNVIEMWARPKKHVRAGPISSLYEQGRVHHVGGFTELENQMIAMTSAGYEGAGSPDRVDALVWAMTVLFPAMIETKPHKIPKYNVRAVV